MCGQNDRNPSFWASLPPADQEALRRIGRARPFIAGSVLLRQNERTNHVLILFQGCVKVAAAAREGYHTILALRDSGDLLGELASTDGSPRSATLYALTDVRTLIIDSRRFEQIQRLRPTIGDAVNRVLSARLRESDHYLATVGCESVEQRLAGTLLRIGARYGKHEAEGLRITLPLSQDDLAGLAFTSRRTIGRILAEWRESGWVSTGRRSVLLRNVAALDVIRSK